MRFVSLILSACTAVVIAQSNPNPFNIPNEGLQFTAGEPKEIAWDPTTSGTVTLVLRSGSSNDLIAGTQIASKIPNNGHFTWTPDSDITRGSDYTIEIISDSNPDETNFTPFFIINSDNTVATSTSPFTYGATATTLSSATRSASGSASASASASASDISSAAASSGTAASSGAAASSTAAASSSESSNASGTSSSSITVATTDSGNGAAGLRAAWGLMAVAAIAVVFW